MDDRDFGASISFVILTAVNLCFWIFDKDDGQVFALISFLIAATTFVLHIFDKEG